MEICILLLAILSTAQCHQSYQARIPNGIRVPDPCNDAQFWPGVGHQKKAGGGTRNPFGVLIGTLQVQWGKSACQADSDGDGRTNGEELGDPNCQWTIGGNPPALSTNLSHPGICEPINSQTCCQKQTWLYCHSTVCNNTNSNSTTTAMVSTVATNGSDDSTTLISSTVASNGVSASTMVSTVIGDGSSSSTTRVTVVTQGGDNIVSTIIMAVSFRLLE